MKTKARTTILLLGDVAVAIGAFYAMIKIAFGSGSTQEEVALHATPFYSPGAFVFAYILYI